MQVPAINSVKLFWHKAASEQEACVLVRTRACDGGMQPVTTRLAIESKCCLADKGLADSLELVW